MKWLKILLLALVLSCSPTKRTIQTGNADTSLSVFPYYDTLPPGYYERLKVTINFERGLSARRKTFPRKTIIIIVAGALVTGIVVGKVLLKFL
jgi:hypothetical protein